MAGLAHRHLGRGESGAAGSSLQQLLHQDVWDRSCGAAAVVEGRIGDDHVNFNEFLFIFIEHKERERELYT